MITEDADREMRLAALDASIARGIADSETDRTVDIEEAAARLDPKYGAMLLRD